MGETELYRELGQLTGDRGAWEESIPSVASLLSHESVKIRAKALWLLGEMGLAHPEAVRDAIPAIAAFMGSPEPHLRERAANALGRIGRADFQAIGPYWEDLFRLAEDDEAKVRLAFVWASENIATNTPDAYAEHLSVFGKLLHDGDEKVRIEAPEMFRVLGKRRPELVLPYLGQLQTMAETDENRVVRIHCQGAIRATESH
ncbi:MAG: HEAT repeat domain-containing protein [Atopobiaceae bacterium]|nr:HEAT repeat domain-containing protein [Atopobiaceae bacterium]